MCSSDLEDLEEGFVQAGSIWGETTASTKQTISLIPLTASMIDCLEVPAKDMHKYFRETK